MASSVTVKCKAAILFLQDAVAPRSCTYVSSKHRDKAVLCVGGLGKHPDSDSEAVSPDLTSNSHCGKVEQSQTEHLRSEVAVGPRGCAPVHGYLPSPDWSGAFGCPSSLDTYEYTNALEFAFCF